MFSNPVIVCVSGQCLMSIFCPLLSLNTVHIQEGRNFISVPCQTKIEVALKRQVFPA